MAIVTLEGTTEGLWNNPVNTISWTMGSFSPLFDKIVECELDHLKENVDF